MGKNVNVNRLEASSSFGMDSNSLHGFLALGLLLPSAGRRSNSCRNTVQ